MPGTLCAVHSHIACSSSRWGGGHDLSPFLDGTQIWPHSFTVSGISLLIGGEVEAMQVKFWVKAVVHSACGPWVVSAATN